MFEAGTKQAMHIDMSRRWRVNHLQRVSEADLPQSATCVEACSRYTVKYPSIQTEDNSQIRLESGTLSLD